MFCPNCGRDSLGERKFCASCGTNLEAVSQVLSGTRDGFLTKTDAALDHLIGRYAEHIFKDAPSKASDRKVGNSWKLLGQGIVASAADVILFFLMWNIIPLRFLLLLLSTPFRLLSQRSSNQASRPVVVQGGAEGGLREPLSDRWLPDSFPSISEHTTQNLEDPRATDRKRIARKE